jgi:hypothetical protein
MIGYYTPYLFIVKSATQERSIPELRAVFLLSVIGTLNYMINRMIERIRFFYFRF